MKQMSWANVWLQVVVIATVLMTLAACADKLPVNASAGVLSDINVLGDGDASDRVSQASAGEPTVGSNSPPNDANSSSSDGSPPQISGSPPANAAANDPYVFQPLANDPDGDQLEFTVTNKPSWLSFNSASGQLSGTAGAADVGLFSGITIYVTDGIYIRTLESFSIEVVSIGSHSVTLSWMSPTQNLDDSPLLNLAGFRIRYGNESGVYFNLLDIDNPGITAYGIDGLIPDTYYFIVSAYNTEGLESEFSNETFIMLN